MPGLWTLSAIASDIERNYWLRHPKPSHFRVRQHKGLLDRAFGNRDDRWWIHHVSFPALFCGPFACRSEAEQGIPLVVIMLQLANPKLKPETKAQLLAEMKERAHRGEFGETARRDIASQSFLSILGGTQQSESPNLSKRYCQMLWIASSKVAILVGRSTSMGTSIVSG